MIEYIIAKIKENPDTTSIIFSSFIVFVVQLTRLAFEHISTKNKIESTQQEQFDTVISSDNLESLGLYLDKNLGDVSIRQYVENHEIRSRVTKYLYKIQNYLSVADKNNESLLRNSTESQIPTETPEPEEGQSTNNSIAENWPDEFMPIIHELDNGETWNSLARLRRTIEIKLNRLADSHGLGKFRSYSSLLNTMIIKEVISPFNAYKIKQILSIANAAIHGEEVDYATAYGAIERAKNVLKMLPD